ncbi:MAG: hemolysin family protein [Chloroflexota bacterium]|nr:hemolysin family protein [Chloroflexota bacterium]
MNETLSEILILIILILLNAVFVAAEISLVTLRRSRVDQLIENGNHGARLVRRLIDDPGRFLAVIQIAITFIGFLASAFAAVSLTVTLDRFLRSVGLDPGIAGGSALVLVTILLSLFTIVFGELVPKTLALAYPERFALSLARLVDVLGRLLTPVVALLTAITRAITAPFGADVSREAQITADELKLIIERGGQQGILEAEEEQMINAVIELGERRLHEVMIPRTSVVALPVSATFEEAIDTIVDEGHSRVPVYEESIDEVVGILYAKDLLPYLKSSAEPRPAIRAILRTPVFAPESMTIDDLLHDFQRKQVHIAIVLDEYGGTAGLVTIEDLLEEIVGEIQDEYDEEEDMIVRLSDDEIRVDGRVAVDELAELFDTILTLEDEDEYDTIGGLVFHRIGRVPVPGDQVHIDGLRLTVESTDGRRVSKVLVVRQRPGDEGVDDEADR